MRTRHNVSYFIFSCFWITIAAVEFRFDYTFSSDADGWLKLHEVPAVFKAAMLICKAEGALLASPLNAGLRNAMLDLYKPKDNDCGVFTGIHASFFPGYHASIEGVPLSRIPLTWAKGEPDNFNNIEHCTMMLKDGTMADVSCNETHPYICYRKKSVGSMVTACGTVDNEYKYESRTGSCYKFHRIGANWRRAYMTCMAEGGHLAIINSDTEVQIIKEILGRFPPGQTIGHYTDRAAIGIYAPADNNDLLTIHGQTLEEAGYSSFSPGEPNNYGGAATDGGQYCGAVYRNGLLDDFWCNTITMPFICEKNPHSLMNDI